MNAVPTIVTLTGPSCAGKSHLERLLKESGFASVISTTTRPPRAGEVDGEHYHFVSRLEFARLQTNGEFVESVEFNGNSYGVTETEMKRVAAAGKPIVVVVEPHGAKQYREYAMSRDWNILSVFINNPPELIARRFLERFKREVAEGNCDALDSYAKRMAHMAWEEVEWVANPTMEYDLWFDHFDGNSTEPITAFVVNHIAELMKHTGDEVEAA